MSASHCFKLSSLASWTLCTLFKPCANDYSQPLHKSTLTTTVCDVRYSGCQTTGLYHCNNACVWQPLCRYLCSFSLDFSVYIPVFFNTHAYTRTCTNVYQPVKTSAIWVTRTCEWRSYTLLHLYPLHRVDCVVSIHSFTLLWLYTSDRKRCMCHSNKDLHLQIGDSHETKRSYLQPTDCHLDLLFFH